MNLNTIKKVTLGIALSAMTLTPILVSAQDSTTPMAPPAAMKMEAVRSNPFKGIEASKGTVSYTFAKGVGTLEVSKDFVVPKSPAPHWQIVDNEGNTYLLKQFRIAGDKVNTKLVLPKYIHSVAKVQVWCSFAEVLLGEASFAKPIMIHRAMK